MVRTRPGLAAALVAAGIALLLCGEAAPARAVARCTFRSGTRTIAHGPGGVRFGDGQVGSDSSRFGPYEELFVCVPGGRPRLVWSAPTEFGADDYTFTGFHFAGHYAAFFSTDASGDGPDGTLYRVIERVDVTHGGAAEMAHYLATELGNVVIGPLLLNPSGDLAWLAAAESQRPTERGFPFSYDRIRVVVGHASRVLDNGPLGSLTDLRLTGSRLSWLNAGRPRAAAI